MNTKRLKLAISRARASRSLLSGAREDLRGLKIDNAFLTQVQVAHEAIARLNILLVSSEVLLSKRRADTKKHARLGSGAGPRSSTTSRREN